MDQMVPHVRAIGLYFLEVSDRKLLGRKKWSEIHTKMAKTYKRNGNTIQRCGHLMC